jgi:hypothetical protein
VPASWKAVYETQVAGVWLLLVPSVLFLARLAVRGWAPGPGVEPYAARWVRIWTVVFALAAVADPIATGIFGLPLAPFVLLGDFRIFALLLPVMQPGRSRAGALLEAVAWTVPVPLLALGVIRAKALALGVEPPGLTLWMTYEAAFAGLAVFFATRVVPRRVGVERPAVRRYAVAVMAFVTVYYVLWGASDVLVARGVDAGWALRVVPNVLYYGVLVPYAYWRFFGRL